MSLEDFVLGGQFTKETLYRYLPAENLRCGNTYLLKGHGKGKIERIYAKDGRVISDAATTLWSNDVRLIEVRLQGGQLKTVTPLRTDRSTSSRPTRPKKSRTPRNNADSRILILANNKGIWLRQS